MNYTNLQLGLYEFAHHDVHGINENSDPKLCEKLFAICTFEPHEFYSNDYQEMIEHINDNYNIIHRGKYITHPTIRNYSNIINDVNYIKLEIIEKEILPTQECVCIIKTFWIKIIQRTWKHIYRERKMLLKKFKNFRNLLNREINGKYPNGLTSRDYPEFRLNLKI